MNAKSYSLEGALPYKLDAKSRVSIPSDWRADIGNGVLRLLASHNEKIPTLKVLTESEFEKMQRDIEESEKLTHADKRVMLGALFERSMKTTINEQGKLSIPKAQMGHPALVPGGEVMLCGRGSYFEIFNEENFKKLEAARAATLQALDAEFGYF